MTPEFIRSAMMSDASPLSRSSEDAYVSTYALGLLSGLLTCPSGLVLAEIEGVKRTLDGMAKKGQQVPAVIFEPYSVGLVCMSVCTNIEDRAEIERRANEDYLHLGSDLRWSISKDLTFRKGQPNPCQCETNPDCKHWLLNC